MKSIFIMLSMCFFSWTTYAQKLQIEGNGPSDGIKVTRSGSEVETELWSDIFEGGVGTQSNHDFRFVTNNSFRGEISANGNWGIGTGNTNPVEQLDVSGAIKLGNTSANNPGTIRFNGSDFLGLINSEWVSLTAGGSGGVSIWNTNTNGIDYLSGNVGIGINNPTGATLHVEGNGPSDGIKVTRSGSEVETELWSDIFEGGVGTQSNHDFRFVTNNSFRGEISANGNWGIGTGNTNPVEQLDVSGAIKLGNTNANNPGTIRFNGSDFLGLINSEWVSLTAGLQGEKGDTGAQGPAGPAGATGPAGPVATTVLNNIQDQLIQPSSPNGNIIIGEFAGVDLSLGEFDFQGKRNTLIGSNAGFKLTTGSDNTLLGNFSGSRLTSASGNTFLGTRAGELCTIGSQNTFVGRDAGAYTNGFHNIAMGDFSLIYGTGSNNVAIGNSSGEHSESSHNVFIGHEAGQGNQNAPNSGSQNTFVGSLSGKTNSSGSFNSFYGYSSGNSNTDGLGNAFFGYSSGGTNSSGSSNTFLGGWAGRDNQAGSDNVYIGANAGSFSNAGSNVYIGFGSGRTSLGANNTFIGFQSGRNCTGANNILIGSRAGFSEDKSNVLIIENSDSSTPLIYGEFDNNKVQINGALHISEFARLIPSLAPSSPEKGTMYYDSLDNKVRVWTGANWENLFFTSSNQTENYFTQNSESPCNASCLEENQKLSVRVEQLEAKLKKYETLVDKLERIDQSIQQLSMKPIVRQQVEINKVAKLEQNIPNPFHSSTKIQYFLPLNTQNSSINIYNVSGQIVKTIQLEGSGKGEIEVQVDEFSKGIYHYTLEINGRIIDTKKMSALR